MLSDLYVLLSGWEVDGSNSSSSSTSSSNTGLGSDLKSNHEGINGWGLDELWQNGVLLIASGIVSTNNDNIKIPISKSHNRQYIPQAMSAMSQRVLMEPWNWMVLARYGELAVLNG